MSKLQTTFIATQLNYPSQMETLIQKLRKGKSKSKKTPAKDLRFSFEWGTRINGWAQPIESIEEALKLIRVSRLHAPQKLNWTHTEKRSSS